MGVSNVNSVVGWGRITSRYVHNNRWITGDARGNTGHHTKCADRSVSTTSIASIYFYTRAILSLIPLTDCSCTWHIMKNVQARIKDSAIVNGLKKIIYSTDSPETVEASYTDLIGQLT